MKIITDDISKYDKGWWEKFYTNYGHHNNQEELETFKTVASVVGDKTILDIGCGEGEASQFFNNYKGIDWSDVVIERANKRFGNKFRQNSNLADLKGEHYDYALFSQVMEHLENPIEYIKQIKKLADKVIVIIPNGDIGEIIVNNDKNYIKDMEAVDYHYATYTDKDIDQMFENVEWVSKTAHNLIFIV